MKILEQIEAFGESQGGVTFVDLLNYAFDNDKKMWVNVITGARGFPLVLELLRAKGWDETITEEDVSDAVHNLAEQRGEKAANEVMLQILASRDERFAEILRKHGRLK